MDKELLVKLLVEDDPTLARYTPEQLAGQLSGTMKRVRDDYAAAQLTSVEDIRDRFCANFYWGCEADDPLVGVAFDHRVTPLGALVPAIFASDLGHWDVPDFDEPLEEACELVERRHPRRRPAARLRVRQPGAVLRIDESRVLRRDRDRAGGERRPGAVTASGV